MTPARRAGTTAATPATTSFAPNSPRSPTGPAHAASSISGVLHDPYLGLPIRFDKAHAGAVQIDHIVPLAWAWDLGANTWTPAQRAAFANDEQLELLAVNGPANEKKADNGPAGWLNVVDPPDYARRYIAVLAHYQLPIDVADKAALTTVLNGDHR